MSDGNTQTTPVLLLTPRQAARQVLAISEKTLYNYTKAGLIPVIWIGRCKRYSLADLQAFIDRAKSSRESS